MSRGADAHAPTGRRLLVRHAATAWSGRRYAGRSDPPLTAEGREAARRLADALARWDGRDGPSPPRLVTSPMARALATARPIAAVLGVEPEVDERWAETDFGRFEGRTWAELEAADPALAAHLASGDTEIDWPGGETAAAFRARVAAALAAVLADARPTVVVAHAGPIRLAIALAAGTAAASVALPPPAGLVVLPEQGPPERSPRRVGS